MTAIFTESEYEIELSAVQGPAGALPPIAASSLLGNTSGSTAVASAVSASSARTLLSINNVDNTSDANKPISTATQIALDAKQDASANLDRLDGTVEQQRAAIGVEEVSVSSFAALLASTDSRIKWTNPAGGEFRLSSDQVTAADNVLRFERDDNTIIERVWDGTNFEAEWVQLNLAVPGTILPTKTGDKLLVALHVMPQGAVLNLASETTYEIDYPLRPVKDVTIDGRHGSVIKRGPQISSLLTANANAGSTSVTVADASQFRVNMRAFVVKTPGVIGGHAMVDGTTTTFGSGGFIITSIVGNVVSFGAAQLQQNCVIGNKLVALEALMITDNADARITVRNVIFDGNKSQHSDVNDWAAGYGCALAWGNIENCRFINMPNENLTISSGSVTNCWAENCNGSFFHASSAVQANARGILIQNCYTKNMNTIDSGHTEGVITFSAQSQNIRVRDCVFDNSAGTKGIGVFGLLDSFAPGDTDANFYAENVVAKNFGQIIQLTQGGGTAVNFDRVVIESCTFEQCGDIEIGTSNTLASGPFIKEVKILNCTLVDGWMWFQSVQDLDLSGTKITSSLTPYVFAGSSSGLSFATLPSTRMGGAALQEGDIAHLQSNSGGNLQGIYVRTAGAWVYNAALSAIHGGCTQLGRVSIYYCGDVRWIGGGIVGHPGSKAGTGLGRVGLQIVPAMVDNDAGTATTTAYGKVTLSDLTIENQLFALMSCTIGNIGASVDDPWNTHPGFDANGWTYTNVRIYAPRDNYWFFPIGIQVPSGCIAQDCLVVLPSTATFDFTCGIQLHGPMDETRSVGGIAKNCTVPFTGGTGQSIRLGRMVSSTALDANCVAVNNIVAKIPAQVGSRQQIISNNTIVSSATLTGLTSQSEIYARPVGYGDSLY